MTGPGAGSGPQAAGPVAQAAVGLPATEQERLVSPLADADERAIEGALRPKRLADFIGQARVREQLSLVLTGALRRAVAAEDVTALTQVPGIGRKGAQRIVLELAGRLGAPGSGAAPGPAAGAPRPGAEPWREQVRAGLVSLGWQAREADQAIAAVAADLAADGGAADGDGTMDVATMLRSALRKLSRV